MRTDLPDINIRKTYNYDDYRKEIAEIMKRNGKRIKITEVLRQCGISKGNYYLFMNVILILLVLRICHLLL